MTAHVVALSGGKDSTAMALRLAEVEPQDYAFVCTPTGNELPAMFSHWRRLGDLLGRPILPINTHSLTGLIDQYGALPNWKMRWCTRQIKIEPFAAFLTVHSPAVAYVGLRADEEDRPGGYYGDVPNVTVRHPLREWGWGLSDVLGYLDERGVEIPKRTDCGLCFFQRLGEWFDLWKEHPEAYAEGERIEARYGHTFRSPGRDTWPAGLTELRHEFERGRIPKDRQQGSLFASAQCRVCSL